METQRADGDGGGLGGISHAPKAASRCQSPSIVLFPSTTLRVYDLPSTVLHTRRLTNRDVERVSRVSAAGGPRRSTGASAM
jgi:hypothetical protein